MKQRAKKLTGITEALRMMKIGGWLLIPTSKRRGIYYMAKQLGIKIEGRAVDSLNSRITRIA